MKIRADISVIRVQRLVCAIRMRKKKIYRRRKKIKWQTCRECGGIWRPRILKNKLVRCAVCRKLNPGSWKAPRLYRMKYKTRKLLESKCVLCHGIVRDWRHTDVCRTCWNVMYPGDLRENVNAARWVWRMWEWEAGWDTDKVETWDDEVDGEGWVSEVTDPYWENHIMHRGGGWYPKGGGFDGVRPHDGGCAEEAVAEACGGQVPWLIEKERTSKEKGGVVG